MPLWLQKSHTKIQVVFFSKNSSKYFCGFKSVSSASLFPGAPFEMLYLLSLLKGNLLLNAQLTE